MSCGKPLVSQPNLYQIQLSGTVLESSGQADSETAIDFNIWPRFEGVIEVSLGDKWNFHYCITFKESLAKIDRIFISHIKNQWLLHLENGKK